MSLVVFFLLLFDSVSELELLLSVEVVVLLFEGSLEAVGNDVVLLSSLLLSLSEGLSG
jgi:hypothetical protein